MEKAKSDSGANRNKRKFTYAYSRYVDGDGLYIVALENDEPYDDVTINLFGYGYMPGLNQVIIPTYKLEPELVEAVKKDLVKKTIEKIHYGPFDAWGELVELKDDWDSICKPIESYSSN